MSDLEKKELQNELVNKLLFPLFQCIDSDYKQKYKINIWEQFQNHINIAANNGTLIRFLDKFKRLVPCSFSSKFDESIVDILSQGKDDIYLKLMRNSKTHLMMLCRIKNEQKKADYKEKVAQQSIFNEPINPTDLYEDDII